MGGNKDLTTEGKLIEEIEVEVGEMRKENNEKGSTASMKIKIKITFVNQFAVSPLAYLSGRNIMHLIYERRFSASVKNVLALGQFFVFNVNSCSGFRQFILVE